MTIEFNRRHVTAALILWGIQMSGVWATLDHAFPQAVSGFVHGFGWLGIVLILNGAGTAFLTVVIWTKLLGVILNHSSQK
jgi:hypothetical protein